MSWFWWNSIGSDQNWSMEEISGILSMDNKLTSLNVIFSFCFAPASRRHHFLFFWLFSHKEIIKPTYLPCNSIFICKRRDVSTLIHYKPGNLLSRSLILQYWHFFREEHCIQAKIIRSIDLIAFMFLVLLLFSSFSFWVNCWKEALKYIFQAMEEWVKKQRK